MNKQLPFESLSQQLLDNDFVTILLFNVPSLLILEWKRQITLPERQAGFTQALYFTNQRQIKYWLVDDLQLYIISPAEKAWILTEWIEVAVKSSILKLAVVCADYYPALMANTYFTEQGKAQYQCKSCIQHEVFTDYKSAFNWLFPDNRD